MGGEGEVRGDGVKTLLKISTFSRLENLLD